MSDNVVRVKEGVEFSVIAPAGFRILSALVDTAFVLRRDLTITSGTDGEHSGPSDPHKLGEAYDVRSHDFDPEQRDDVLHTIMSKLDFLDTPFAVDGGVANGAFWGFLEAPGTPNEHFHVQRRRGVVYP
jgi:hypothetical protein